VSAAVKAEVIAWVLKTEQRSGWPLHRILRALGVSRSRYYEWLTRQGGDRLEDEASKRTPLTRLLDEEKAAICAFAQRHPKIGYRKLAWMMIDENIVSVDESSVYRVLSEADLLYRYKRADRSDGQYRFRPTGPNQQWHTDVMYIWVVGCWYFLVSFIDAYSRYVVHHKLMLELNGRAMANELQAALDTNPGAHPRLVHDHGSEYVNRDLAAVIKVHNLLDIKTRARHPESNGIAERFTGPFATPPATTTAKTICRLRARSPSWYMSTMNNACTLHSDICSRRSGTVVIRSLVGYNVQRS
jgi:putative transposase